MKRIFQGWREFWFGPCDPLPAAACRVGLALLLLLEYLALTPNWRRFFAADGMISLDPAEAVARRAVDPWCLFNWTEGWLPVEVYWVVAIAGAVALLVGWHTRLATVVLCVLHGSLVHRNTFIVNGEDLVARMLLFYGAFSCWGDALSLDARRAARRDRPADGHQRAPEAWPVRLMQINFMLIYAISLPYKFAQDPSWLSGEALHWTVASTMWWRRGFLSGLTLWAGGLAVHLMTWGTLLVEGLYPVLVCFRRTRMPIVLAIVSLHLGIAMSIPGVVWFTLSMVAGAMLYVPGDVLRRVGNAASALATGQIVPALTNLARALPPMRRAPAAASLRAS